MSEKRFHCQHCGEKISKTLYYQHKKKYYCLRTGSWKRDSSETSRQDPEAEFADFTFSDSESEVTLEGIAEINMIQHHLQHHPINTLGAEDVLVPMTDEEFPGDVSSESDVDSDREPTFDFTDDQVSFKFSACMCVTAWQQHRNL